MFPALSLIWADDIPHSPGGDPTGNTKSKWYKAQFEFESGLKSYKSSSGWFIVEFPVVNLCSPPKGSLKTKPTLATPDSCPS